MADENKKGITVKIDADLHAQVKEYIESRGMTMAEFITAACDDLLHPKITEKEDKKMENMRTVAFQVPESLFQRIKDYLQRNNMTQRQFLLGLIETELDRDLTEREAAVEAVSDDQEQEDTVLSEGEETACEGEAEEENTSEEYGDYDDDELEDESEDADESEDEEESTGMVMGMCRARGSYRSCGARPRPRLP